MRHLLLVLMWTPWIAFCQGDECVVLGVQQLTSLAGDLQNQIESLSNRVDSLEIELSNINPAESSLSVPSYLRELGQGTEDLIVQEGQNLLVSSGEYVNIQIQAGAQLQIAPHSTTVLRCSGHVQIDGEIMGNGNNGAGGSGPYSNSVHLMSAGGGTGGGYTGDGDNWNCNFINETGSIQGFDPSDFFEVTTLGGGSDFNFSNGLGALAVFPYLHGGNGGTSYYWVGSSVSCGRSGGQGGAGLYIIANSIDVSGAINVNGGDGQNCYQAQQGYLATGGGGAGRVVLAGSEVSFSGIFSGSGGSGGTCSNTNPYAMSSASPGGDGELVIVEY